ncbi:MAG: CAP domain-containing protein [Chloroflexi bacterium]|nr:CAP domain-containing protein [Chloroflexota bacterium]
MEDWLQLTEEDLERATKLARSRPHTPGVLTINDKLVITGDDIAHVSPPPRPSSTILTITLDDLKAREPDFRPTDQITTLEQIMFVLVNEARTNALPGWLGTTKLRWHDGLAAVARGHSADMLRRQYVSHITPDGFSSAQRIERQGISYVACGENIGIVYGESSHTQQGVYDIHNAFMNQPRSLTNHRGNLLNPVWTHIGIGIAYNPDGALVVTQKFISAPATRLRQK